jgi:hypothetical protein
MKKLYQCDICKEVYNVQKEAEACEKKGLEPFLAQPGENIEWLEPTPFGKLKHDGTLLKVGHTKHNATYTVSSWLRPKQDKPARTIEGNQDFENYVKVKKEAEQP